MGVLGSLLEDVALRSDIGDGRHHEFLADRIDRGIRDLGEKLLEVAEEKLRSLGEAGEGNVNSHGADGLGAIDRHWRKQHALMLDRVPEHSLPLQQGVEIGLSDRFCRRKRVEMDQVAVQPLSIGLPIGDRLFDLGIADDLSSLHVDEEHPPGLQAPLGAHVSRLDVRNHARFGRHHDEVVVRHRVPRRPQSIAIERAAHVAAVREDDRRRTVPRLHHRGVELVEGPLVVLHVLVG